MKTSTFLLYEAMLNDEKTETKYRYLLSDKDKIRRDRRIPRAALRKFNYSSFNYLYKSGNDQALLNATGHDHRSFKKLLSMFKYFYDFYMVDPYTGRIRAKVLDKYGKVKGTPHELPAFGALGLVLMWYRTRGPCSRTLAMMFGLTSTPMYKWLKFSMKVLLHALSRNTDYMVKKPTYEEVRFYQSAIAEKYPLCRTNVIVLV